MPKPKERPAAKKAAPAAKVVPKPKPLADKAKTAAKAKPAPAKAAKSAPVKAAKPAAAPAKAAKPAPVKAAKPVAKSAKPAAKPQVVAKTQPAAKAKPVAAPAKAKPAAAPAKPVATLAKPVAAKSADKPKAATNAGEKPKPAAKPAAVAKPAPAASVKPAPAPAAKPAPALIAKAKPAVDKAAKPVKGETKPVVAITPVVEKQLKPAKIIAPVSPSKVVKMSKQTEHANGHSAKGMPKCPFNAEELDQWRKLLIARRTEISSDIGALEKDAMEAEDGHTTPLHAAERGSDADLQDVSLGLAGEEKDLLWQIDRAIRKIDANSPLPFGVCEHTREPIPKLRLQLIPWTPLSIEGATYLEENGLTVEDLLIDD